jgi:hypothetical protein
LEEGEGEEITQEKGLTDGTGSVIKRKEKFPVLVHPQASPNERVMQGYQLRWMTLSQQRGNL